MPQKKMIRVRAVQNPDGSPRLFPHPAGFPGQWLGWERCPAGEKPDHVIEGAAGVALKDGPKGPMRDVEQSTGDLFRKGPDIALRRVKEGVLVEETREIRTALRCGDLDLCEEAAAEPPAPATRPRGR